MTKSKYQNHTSICVDYLKRYNNLYFEKGDREKKESEQHDWDAALGGHK